MRIGYDVRPFLRDETGIGVYYRSLLTALAGLDGDNHYCLFSSSLKSRFQVEKLPGFRHASFRDFRIPVKLLDWSWRRFSFPTLDRLMGTRLDLTHSPVPRILPTSGKTIVTVHDLFFLDRPDLIDRATDRNFTHWTEKSLSQAAGIIAVSRSVRDRIMSRFTLDSTRIRVIYHGLSPAFRSDISASDLNAVRMKYRLPGRFVMFLGSIEPRKNLSTLIAAMEIVCRRMEAISLVIAGHKGSDYPRVRAEVVARKLDGRVMFLDYLPDHDIKALYRLASLFVFPSFYEGFGLPLLESMAAGLPITSADTGALPEIAGRAARYFNPEDPEDMAENMISVLQSESIGAELIRAGKERVSEFRWEKAAAETLEFYRDTLERGD